MRTLLFTLALLPIIAFGQQITINKLNIIPINITEPSIPEIRVQPDFDVKSEVVFVYDLTSNESVYDKNSTQQMSIASITKMMTAYVVLSQHVNMNEVITLTRSDIALSNKGSAHSKLKAGMRFTRERLLNLALMASENRAAAALGRTTFDGGVNEFVQHMNDIAKTLGMDHTHYVDPIGIGAGNVSTAADLVKLLVVASHQQMIRNFSTTKWKEVKLPTRHHHSKLFQYHNTDALVGFSDWNILVQKTGFTTAAGHCVVMVVVIERHQYAVIELNAPTNQTRAFDAIKLRHYVEDDIDDLSPAEILENSPYRGILFAHNKVYKHRHHT